jgi:hypothetical protein
VLLCLLLFALCLGLSFFSPAMTRIRTRSLRILLAFSVLFATLEIPTPAYGARVVSKRLQYVGRTPGKKTRTGRAVLKRWHDNGKARWTGTGKPDYKQTDKWEVKVYTFDSATKTLSATRVWRPLDRKIAMGHKLAAVDFWNHGAAKSKIYSPIGKEKKNAIRKARYKAYQKAGREGKAKSEIVRKFMLDPSNYRFEHLGANSHFGALSPENYLPPKK